jgi:hypothetical protein
MEQHTVSFDIGKQRIQYVSWSVLIEVNFNIMQEEILRSIHSDMDLCLWWRKSTVDSCGKTEDTEWTNNSQM